MFMVAAALILFAALKPSGRGYKALADGWAVIQQSGAPRKFVASLRGEQQESGYLEGLFPADGDPEARRAMEEIAAEVGAPRRRTNLRLKHGADDIDRFE